MILFYGVELSEQVSCSVMSTEDWWWNERVKTKILFVDAPLAPFPADPRLLTTYAHGE